MVPRAKNVSAMGDRRDTQFDPEFQLAPPSNTNTKQTFGFDLLYADDIKQVHLKEDLFRNNARVRTRV